LLENKIFCCTAEQNTVNLRCMCWQIKKLSLRGWMSSSAFVRNSKFFAAWVNEIYTKFCN
jgi:hypothetical protein